MMALSPGSTPLFRGRMAVLLLGLVLAAGPLLHAAPAAKAATTFTVTTTGDEPDLLLTDPVCDVSPDEGNQCTLRAAIQEANATPGPDTIRFAIPGGGIKSIRPATLLPAITNRVTIDGYTQPGASPNTAAAGTNAQLRIELDGSAIPGFADYGLNVESGDGTVIRGLVINRFNDDGIEVEEAATNTRIAGSFIGTNAAGTADRGNSFGVYADGAKGTRIGGPAPAARNLIAGNDTMGVLIENGADGTRVLGNLIGTTRSGGDDLGNGVGVVVLAATSTFVGGATAAEANVIAFSGDDGVVVDDTGIGTRILRNSIFANAGIGIDLGDNGMTPNDDDDNDDGPNTLQNFPDITAATSTSVTGTLNSTPNQDFVLRLFSNPGTGDEGEVFEDGPLVVTTDVDGNASFTFTPDPPIPAGRSVTATATNQGGNTSEFSPAVQVSGS